MSASEYSSMVMPSGARLWAARRSAVLNEPLRRLPLMPRTFMAGSRRSSGSFQLVGEAQGFAELAFLALELLELGAGLGHDLGRGVGDVVLVREALLEHGDVLFGLLDLPLDALALLLRLDQATQADQ